MNPNDKPLRPSLVAQLPQASEFAKLQAETIAAIETEQIKLKRQRLAAQAFWIFCAVMATGYMWFGPESERVPRAPFLACLFILWGGIELLKERIQSARTEILKETKLVQLKLMELTLKIQTEK